MIAQADDTTAPAPTAAVRSRIGVRGRLFLAFSAIAGLAVALASLAILSFTEMGGVLEQITSERLPPITAALQLARTSENIVALGPAIAGADDLTQLATRVVQLTEQKARVQSLLSRLEAMDIDKSEFAGVRGTMASLGEIFATIEKNANERLVLKAKSAALLDGRSRPIARFKASSSFWPMSRRPIWPTRKAAWRSISPIRTHRRPPRRRSSTRRPG